MKRSSIIARRRRRRPRRRPPRHGHWLLATITLVCLACSPAERLPSWHDLLFDPALAASGGEEMSEIYCADETRWARTLEDQTTLTVPIEITAETRLTVGGCRRSGDPDAVLNIEVIPTKGDPVTHNLGAGQPHAWWQRTIELTDLRPGAAELRLTTNLPSGKFFLRELAIESLGRDETEGDPAPKILLISIDTLRADLDRWNTPTFDQLASESTTYSNSWAAAHWTKPSHATLLTGTRPSVHGALTWETGIHPEIPTIAEHLAAAGFVTGGSVFDCLHLEPRFGFGRGFASYTVSRRTPEQQIRATLEWMREHRTQKGFYFFHNYDVHSDFVHLPYESPEASREWVKQEFEIDGYGCRDNLCASGRLAAIGRGDQPPLDRENEVLEQLYGFGVSHIDQQLDMLFTGLRELGLWDETLIIFTSDHGETLLERGHATMHEAHWDEILRVPLWIKWPRGERAGEVVDLPVSGIDIAPTILHAAGLSSEELPGADLATLRRPRPLLLGGAGLRSLVEFPYKLTRSHGETDSFVLFDLGIDPTERNDLYGQNADIVEQLMATARILIDQDTRRTAELDRLANQGDVELSDEERKRLEALGYTE
ncbi:MAG: sulfatase [Acidobacteriota bacterium]